MSEEDPTPRLKVSFHPYPPKQQGLFRRLWRSVKRFLEELFSRI